MEYQISDNIQTWEVEAEQAEAAVETVYPFLSEYHNDTTLAVLVRELVDDGEGEEWETCLYALIERGEEGDVDHRSWGPSKVGLGPIAPEWVQTWIEQS